MTVTLSVESKNDDLAIAQQETSAGVEKVLAVTKTFKFPSEEVQTSSLVCTKVVEVVDEDGVTIPEYRPFGAPIQEPSRKR